MTRVAPWVRALTEDAMGGPPFAIGDRVKSPDGRLVEITGGRYWGTHGLSNWWTWREVLTSGDLGPEECGYGWTPAKEDA